MSNNKDQKKEKEDQKQPPIQEHPEDQNTG